MNFKKWFEKRYGQTNIWNCKYLTKKGWLGCRQQVLKLLEHPSLDMNNTDLKFLKEEIKKL